MSDPTGYTTPKTDWTVTGLITNTDLIRIETNIEGLRLWEDSGSFNVTTTHLPGGEKTGAIYYRVYAGIVVLKLPKLIGTQDAGTTDHINLTPATTWPTTIRVSASGIWIPIVIMNNGAGSPPPDFSYSDRAFMSLPYDNATPIAIQKDSIITDMDNNCGIWQQFVTYLIDTTISPPGTTTTTPSP